MGCALALLALEPLAAGRASAVDDDGTLSAEASGTGMPSYSYHVLDATRADDVVRVELAGLKVDGKDIPSGIAVVRRGDTTLVPAEALLGVLELPLHRGAASLRVETPLGDAVLDLGACERIDGASFCAIDTLAARLALGLVFDPSEFALQVRTAWPRTADETARAAIPIDVPAPAYSLSYARTELGYRHGRDREDFSGTGEFGGGLGSGFWRSAWFQDSSGRRGLYDYAWITQREHSRFLIGHQVMGLDPLLPSFDLLGVQGAWTNRPDAVFGSTLETRRLVIDRFLRDRTLRGEGPPGGRAELRVNGELVDSVTISLSGRYSFDRVQRSVDPLAIVQVQLYERAFDTVPLRVEDRSFPTGDRLLERGATLHFAGVGVQDNPLGDSRLREGIDGETAGFWQGRVGVSERVTLEAAVQRTQEGGYAIAGAHLGLGRSGVLGALVGRNRNGAQALRVQTDGQRRHWFWRGYVQEEDTGYRDRELTLDRSDDRSLRYVESGWMGHRWMLSLVGRQEQTGLDGRRVDFIKPALSVQPLDTVSVSIRPDSEGDYGYLARWAPHSRLYFNAFRDDQRDQFEAHGELSPRTRLIAGWVRDETAGERHSLLGYRDGAGARNWRYGAGVLESEGEFGWLFETGAEIGSGLYLSAQALDDPLIRGRGAGATLWVNLTIDLVNTGRGFARSSYRADYSQNGSISGRVVAPASHAHDVLDGIPVRVDGDVRAYTDVAGGFHVPGLAAGVHRVELDDEKVPFDLAPAQRRLGVEVAPGRSTPVRFGLELRLGLAGRVLDAAGRAVTAATVQLRDADGQDRGSQATDAYGYFRYSDLPPGRYRLSLGGAQGATRVEREVELVDRYVFEQDLQLPP